MATFTHTGLICTRRRTVANGYPASLADGSKVYIDCREPFGNLDLGARWDSVMGHSGLSLMFTMTNVTNNTSSNSNALLEAITGFTAHQPAVPRMWYVTAKYKF